jgi:hypothetical protein
MAESTTIKKSGGRPRTASPEARGLHVFASVRRDEKHRIEQLAAAANVRVSDYIREAALTARIVIKRYRRVEPMLLVDLARIGNNLNQIARICNQTGDSRRAHAIESFMDELRPLLARLHEFQ